MLTLAILNSDFRTNFKVIDFNGCEGIVVPDTPASTLFQDAVYAEIIDASVKVIWSGYVRFGHAIEAGIKFVMLIKSNHAGFIEWNRLPKFLSVSDGGYVAQTEEQVGNLLNDVHQFSNVIEASLYHTTASDQKTIRIPCSVIMEDVRSTDAVLVSVGELDSTLVESLSSIPTILSIEIFESTYILVGLIEGIEDGIGIFTLTEHIYQDQRHSKRRVLDTPVSVGPFKILEVSDFGARIQIREGESFSGDIIEFPVDKVGTVRFKIIHKFVTNDSIEFGCMVSDEEPFSHNWVRFLLQFQYPLLKYRSVDDHSRFWSLLSETGYSTGDFAELNAMIKDDVEEEWRQVDSACPSKGATVVAVCDDRFVGTIGVTRVGKSGWNSQLLATTKDPKHLTHVRSLFSWRTRFILQQRDGLYNIGFFSRDKAFLDRFYRKYYLQVRDSHPNQLVWEEWKLLTHISPVKHQVSSREGQVHIDGIESELFKRLDGDHEKYGAPVHFSAGNDVKILKGRPYQHLCQYFSSAWTSGNLTQQQLEEINNLLGDHHVFTIRSKVDINPSSLVFSGSGKTVDDGWDVVWLCDRPLLLGFMTNSLRALELMQRKYGAKDVA